MTIGGYQAFINFIGKDSVPGIERIQLCVSLLNKICSCQKHRKQVKSEECNNTYITIVKTTMPKMEDYLRTKTLDKEIIFYTNGVHEILRVKLR